MNKKTLIGVGIIIALAIAYWLISPFWKNVALNETLPGANTAVIKDNLTSMDETTKSDFEKQTVAMKDKVLKENDAMPGSGPSIIARADMVARAHEVSGEALLVKSGKDTYLRFEKLKTINGPDLRIYLSAGLNSDDVVDLGSIRATEGNANYLIPAGTEITKYKNAMIWCRAFGVLFSYAQL